MTGLEHVFENVQWDRKFTHSTPVNNIIHVFSESEVEEARMVLADLAEETDTVCRSLHLGEWSTGQKLVVCEEEWDDLGE
ncbi:hypothetical protein [Brevibacillus borstelensis]|uniref:hypothetical protein n=1 Tax=Brevibacillus borstelensis TaxID=45462 RepID=UPI00287F4F4F|nr:hypothetical protein [Brevibacillus borstelensis]WNF07288.1 hypothetical protein RFB14_07620 [Brevibacillus borstelensis]